MSSNIKNKNRRNVVRILHFVLLFCMIGGSVFLGSMAFAELRERKEGNDFYSRLTDGSEYRRPLALKSYDAETAPASPKSEIDFEKLKESCPDAVAWIRINDTVIDYPVVQGTDNDFYLNHLADRTPNKAGSIMMSFANDAEFRDDITILHGHHMRNGSMFGSIEEFRNEEFYQEHPVIRLMTPNGDHDVAIFAAYIVDGYTYGYPSYFVSEPEFDQFIQEAKEATGYDTDVSVSFGDKLLLLSTCTYSFKGARFVLIGKILL